MSQRIWKFIPICLVVFFTGCSKQDKIISGYIEGDLTYIAAPSSGKLLSIAIKKGAITQPHQLLFTLDAAPDSFNVNAARLQTKAANADWQNLLSGERAPLLKSLQAQLGQAQTQATLAKINLQRDAILVKQHFIQQQAYDTQKAEYNTAMEKVVQIKAEIDNAKLAARQEIINSAQYRTQAATEEQAKAEWYLNQKKVSAPVAGEVYDTYYRVGEQVPAYQPVLSILSPTNIFALFYVPERFLSTLKLGQIVQLSCDKCESGLTATLSYISPKAEYTPPVIYSNESKDKLVYRIEAHLTPDIAKKMHPGQPIQVSY